MVVKEPTYKIWAFNSINKATKVADRQWTRLSVWPWVGTLTFPASPETPHQRLQSAICVEKMLGHTIRMTLRFSLSSLHFSLAAAAFQMSVFRPAPVGRSVDKLLWKTLANTIRLSKSKKSVSYNICAVNKNCKKVQFYLFFHANKADFASFFANVCTNSSSPCGTSCSDMLRELLLFNKLWEDKFL